MAMTSLSFKVPEISQVDFQAFHDEHFSQQSSKHFGSIFLRPEEPKEDSYPDDADDVYFEIEEEDDGLGYYPDGVKRTLTDEQIDMFRHSELEALRRAQAKAKEPGVVIESHLALAEALPLDLEDGEVEDDAVGATSMPVKSKKRKKNRSGKNRVMEPKPDLRKRTWDVVDTGLDSLDYDGMEALEAATSRDAQRRRISYNDD